MNNTREKILTSALALFARYGYEAASMSDIAAELQITKGALYRHFANKRAIFEAIIDRMARQDRENAQECGVPEDAVSADAQPYRETGMDAIRSFTLAQFRYWTQDEFASAFRRMLALERYRDAEMMDLYQNYLCAGPLNYMEELFREMAGVAKWCAGDAHALALEFYGPMYLLMDVADAMADKEAAAQQLEEYINRFIQNHS